MDKFFEITSPRDMLEKAKRDFEKLKADLDTDNLFNFFVTVWHVKDYLETALSPLPTSVSHSLKEEYDFRLCRLICDKGKHLKLTRAWHKELDRATEMKRSPGALWGEAMFGDAMWDEGPRNKLLVDGEEIDIIQLGERLVSRWEEVLFSHGQ